MAVQQTRPPITDHLTLSALPSAVGTARRFVHHVLSTWSLAGSIVEDAELVVSELVTNAVNAVGITERAPSYATLLDRARVIIVTVTLLRSSVVVEIWDPSDAPPQRREAGEFAESGRGLSIVESLSARCGWRRMPTGKVVWSEIAVTP